MQGDGSSLSYNNLVLTMSGDLRDVLRSELGLDLFRDGPRNFVGREAKNEETEYNDPDTVKN
jgi:hypothetical protein